jgi:hypothetical protein
MQTLQNLPAALPGLFDPSFSIKVVEVAKKYNEPEVSAGIRRKISEG